VASLLCDLAESSLETGVRVRKGHNFGSDCWISLKILEEFSDAVFLGVYVESLIGDARYRRARPENPLERAITLDATVGSPSKIYRSFRTLFF